jgi:transcriptional regulator with GAF, ATPase, and Fis domain
MAIANLIGSSKAFRDIIDEINLVASINCSVLIQGETGTGKEVIAKAIHDEGPRRNKPFIAINCAAIPSALLESELFGHEKGAFTGAVMQTAGKFLAANGGTIFLDEIGDLPLELQPKLLRVLQEKQFERIGSTRTTDIDVRVIAATNLNLEQMVEEKTFRADLFYRLNVFPLRLPSLREREGDVEQLARYFVRKYSVKFEKQINHIPDDVIEKLNQYQWPGNIRELQNFIERSVIMSSDHVLTPRLAELELMSRFIKTGYDAINEAPRTLSEAERAHIASTLAETNGIIGGPEGAAARLGLPRTTLISRMQRLGLSGRKRSSRGVRLVRGSSQSVFSERTAFAL